MVLVDVHAAARWWNVQPRSVRRWIKAGKLTNHGAQGRALVDITATAPELLDGRRKTAA